MLIYKNDFIDQLVDRYHYRKGSATELVTDFLDLLVANLREGNEIYFHGIGKFGIIQRAERHCVNPNTDEPCISPAHLVPRFYPGNSLKRAVKEFEDGMKREMMANGEYFKRDEEEET